MYIIIIIIIIKANSYHNTTTFNLIKMFIIQSRENIREDVDYLFFICILIFAGLSTLWNIYFIKRILYFVRVYRETIIKVKTDILGNNSEKALLHKVEIVKYMFLLAINVIEVSVALIDELRLWMSHTQQNNATINNCLNGSAISNTDFQFIIGNPIAVVFMSVGRVGLLLTIVLGICLMKYLDSTYHNVNDQSLKFNNLHPDYMCDRGSAGYHRIHPPNIRPSKTSISQHIAGTSRHLDQTSPPTLQNIEVVLCRA